MLILFSQYNVACMIVLDNPCDPNPCDHDGNCTVEVEDDDENDAYSTYSARCGCTSQWVGEFCEIGRLIII